MDRRRAAAGLAAVAVIVAILVVLVLRGSGAGDEDVVTDVAVHVATVGRATLHRYVTAYGYVEPEPAGRGRSPAGALLSPIVGGVLAEINCVEGQRVTEGAVLFRLDSRMAEVTVQRARQDLDFAEKAFARQQELLPSSGTSQRAYQEAQQQLDAARSDLSAAETALAYLRIPAPLTGTVVRLSATVGQFVDPSTVLAEVVALDRLVVTANVPSREATGLEVGLPVFLGADSMAPRGTLRIVGKDIDPRTGTYRVQASIPPGSGFTPGQFTDIRIVAEERREVLAVPEVSLVTRAGEGTWVMVVQGDSAVRRPVTVGLRDGGLIEVAGEGVIEGTTIVTEDAYSLPEVTRIRIVGR
ncbi:MAG: efflux RND transporter periplasmic adaptor subunit [Gemmatimonadales bacterium]|nr:efflux RND transporter periplasmic adaptor subunit [Gemmatimonadales bacterium]